MVMNKRVMGLLGVTRSFGDNSIKKFVIAEPYISSVEMTPECNFAVIGCDGVFDVLSDEDVCAIVKQCIQQNNSQNSARQLVEEALHRDSRDNISAIVIGFCNVCCTFSNRDSIKQSIHTPHCTSSPRSQHASLESTPLRTKFLLESGCISCDTPSAASQTIAHFPHSHSLLCTLRFRTTSHSL